MEPIVLMIATIMRMAGEEGGTGGGGGELVINLLDLQWWQALSAILVAAGLSPAPWILGLATNKIQFTAVAEANYDKRLAEVNQHHDDLVAVKDQRYADLEATAQKNEQALEIEKNRADAATAALIESTQVAKMTVHVIEELRQAAQEVDPDGR